MTTALIAMTTINTSIESLLIVLIIILYLFTSAKIFRAERIYNQNFTETEKLASQPTEFPIETIYKYRIPQVFLLFASIFRHTPMYLWSKKKSRITIVVNISDNANANQIPDTPHNSGNKRKLGTRNIAPRKNANTIAGFILSTLWKYPMAAIYTQKHTKAIEKQGNPFTAI